MLGLSGFRTATLVFPSPHGGRNLLSEFSVAFSSWEKGGTASQGAGWTEQPVWDGRALPSGSEECGGFGGELFWQAMNLFK